MPYFAELARRGEQLPRFVAEAHPSQPNYLAMVGGDTFVRGDEPHDIAATNLADLLARQQRGGNVALDVAIVYAGLGDSDRVFTWLSRAVDDTWLGVNPLLIEIMGPTFQELRRDPRFERLSQRLQLQRR